MYQNTDKQVRLDEISDFSSVVSNIWRKKFDKAINFEFCLLFRSLSNTKFLN